MATPRTTHHIILGLSADQQKKISSLVSADDIANAIELDKKHKLSLEAWAKLLRSLFPKEYRERPLSRYVSKRLPGSDEKIELMARRVARGLSPFHPADARWDQAEAVARAVTRGVNGGVIQGGIRPVAGSRRLA